MKRAIEFRVVQRLLNEQEEGYSWTTVLKPRKDPSSCKIQIKVSTSNLLVAMDELGFGLEMGDSTWFEVTKVAKQLKIAPTEENIEKTTPDLLVKKRGRPRKVKE